MSRLFAKRLRVVMLDYNLIQKQIAVMGKTSQSTVSNVMNGVKPSQNFLNNFYRSFKDRYGDEALEKYFKLRSVICPHLLNESQVLDLLDSFTSPKSKLLRQINQRHKELSKTTVDEILIILQRDLS